MDVGQEVLVLNVSKLKTILLASGATFMAITMIFLPEESFKASIRGLKMWWEIVFPSLFPFFVIAELLIGFGVVRFIGTLLEPLMRPLFKVPGVGGFPWAMGMATGFPAGAKLTARLRQEKQLTKIEAERLVSFTNASSPLFIFGAVSVGFFHNPRLGIILALTHYLGNFCVGLMMRFYGKDGKDHKMIKEQKRTSSLFNIRQALSALHQTRMKNKQPIGKLLGDAVISSIHTLLMIGGFIILFSVLNKLLLLLNITHILASFFVILLSVFQLPIELSIPAIAGIFEITLGSQLTSELANATLMQKTIIVSFILGFSGLSVQAQVASILAETDIDFKPFFVARIFQGIFAAFFTFLLWKPIATKFQLESTQATAPVFLQQHDLWWHETVQYFAEIGPIITILSLMCYIFIYIKRMSSPV